MSTTRLRLPRRLIVATLSLASGAASCGPGSTPDAGDVLAIDAQPDAPAPTDTAVLDAPTCREPPVAGRVCETTCYLLTGPMPEPMACEAWCDVPEGGTTSTRCFTYEGQPMLGCT